ncbi:hypothetical protein ASPSYDRAFT_43211 [Aspergillus sydowii CBS 593.65]|uniref:Uncharacterized protein n=1 Tax=Aspergillus sydowii CBS 593.65 TaxID=1036612 RepID=A0A1L9TPB0_9EURO|nr:uncharacterized protein ASPSYDRAFT_43211 [Aspergillus sydowii CBS 593.65]OJJ61279.1 hypothetical protein ASPSYDRAFT_43211 [Aspergillus sydowii CBS 593.65]
MDCPWDIYALGAFDAFIPIPLGVSLSLGDFSVTKNAALITPPLTIHSQMIQVLYDSQRAQDTWYRGTI